MFGYVRPRKPELLVREFEEYNGIYCSLCRQLGKSYGVPARFALNYDCTFYALVLLSLSERKCPRFSRGRCVVNPLKSCAVCGESEGELKAASALTMLLFYHKLRDDIADSRIGKKILCAAAYPFAAFARRRAAKDYPGMDAIVAEAMKRQSEIEAGDAPELDLCAEPTAHMLESLMGLASPKGDEDPETRVLRQFGLFLGRWIYLIDAADDLAKDLREGAFNPFLQKFGIRKEAGEEQLAPVREYANQVLNMTLAQLGAAVNLMNLNGLGSILRNIVFLGLPQMQKELLYKKETVHV